MYFVFETALSGEITADEHYNIGKLWWEIGSCHGMSECTALL
jgi:hypothetical protein